MSDYPEKFMENNAELTGDQWRYTKANKEHTLRSIAISLKRIADALERKETQP